MNGRMALMRHSRLIRMGVYLLLMSLGCLSIGCGGTPGSDAKSSSKELPPSAKGLQEHMKKRATQIGGVGKQPGGPGGR